MEELILARPTLDDKAAVEDFLAEVIESGSHIAGSGGLERYIGDGRDNYQGWLDKLSQDLDPERLLAGRVLASEFLTKRASDGRIVGLVQIRHELNDFLLEIGGHIGDMIRPKERRKGYGTEQIRLALEKCRELGIPRVLVTCDRDNIASAKTIQKNGGILENEVMDADVVKQRYWIDCSA
ncbi:MAG: GNAT family N-acetyltransferase [Streptococcaceae bacterium]|jgi:predicted acetyltransferase|nr:GNAT family N-acetyltransferase [Streptococcaceae bacterium]